MSEGADEKALKDFDAKLWAPPKGLAKAKVVELAPEWAPEAMGNDFMAQMAARGGAGRVTVSGNKNVDA